MLKKFMLIICLCITFFLTGCGSSYSTEEETIDDSTSYIMDVILEKTGNSDEIIVYCSNDFIYTDTYEYIEGIQKINILYSSDLRHGNKQMIYDFSDQSYSLINMVEYEHQLYFSLYDYISDQYSIVTVNNDTLEVVDTGSHLFIRNDMLGYLKVEDNHYYIASSWKHEINETLIDFSGNIDQTFVLEDNLIIRDQDGRYTVVDLNTMACNKLNVLYTFSNVTVLDSNHYLGITSDTNYVEVFEVVDNNVVIDQILLSNNEVNYYSICNDYVLEKTQDKNGNLKENLYRVYKQ